MDIGWLRGPRWTWTSPPTIWHALLTKYRYSLPGTLVDCEALVATTIRSPTSLCPAPSLDAVRLIEAADVKVSMELLADLDPEEARKLLSPVLGHMVEAVHYYEGTVNQAAGGGLMALFGAPLAGANSFAARP